MVVSAAVTMDTGMFIFCACADAHIHRCLSIKWWIYSIIRYTQLSGMALEQRCPDNRGSNYTFLFFAHTKTFNTPSSTDTLTGKGHHAPLGAVLC